MCIIFFHRVPHPNPLFARRPPFNCLNHWFMDFEWPNTFFTLKPDNYYTRWVEVI